MEMNQKLFDECSQKYKQDRQREKEKTKERDELWNKIEQNAKKNPKYRQFASLVASAGAGGGGNPAGASAANAKGANGASGNDLDDIDDIPSSATLLSRKDLEQEAKEATKSIVKGSAANSGKSQLFRRKSELPHDSGTQSALEKHKQTHDFSLTTPHSSNTKH